MASVFTISPPSASARSSDSPVLPAAVGPTTATTGGRASPARVVTTPASVANRLRRCGVGYDGTMSETRTEQGSTSPGPESDPATPPEPEIHPSSTPEGPSTIPAPSVPQTQPGPDSGPTGEIHARSQTELVNEELQEENAETSLDQPSDAAGNE